MCETNTDEQTKQTSRDSEHFIFPATLWSIQAGGAGAKAVAAKAKSEAPLCERETNGTEEIK